MRSNFPTLLALLGLALGAPGAVDAADPQPYRVDFSPVGDSAIDATLKATSELQSLRGSAPVSPLGLIARARGDLDRLKTVLESYGYYQSAVNIKIDGKALNDPALADALAALPKGTDARVSIGFAQGPLYHLRNIAIDGSLPEAARASLRLDAGAPAVANNVLAAGARLLTALQEDGYAFAKVDTPSAVEDARDPVLDVSFHADAGPRVNIGEIHIEGLKRIHEKLVRSRLLLHTGELYRPSAIERARKDLLTLGVFSTINVKAGTAPDSGGNVPITFDLRERPRHAIALNAAYSSDLGGSAGSTWSDRDLAGGAQQLTLSASVLNLGGSATTGLGYDASAKYLMPDFGQRDQSLQFAVGAIKQSLQAYDQEAVTSSVTLSRKISKIWSASLAVSTAKEHIDQEGCDRDYTLVALPLTIAYDSTDLATPLDDPRHGMRDSLSVAPTLSLLASTPSTTPECAVELSSSPQSGTATFIITQLRVAQYIDVSWLLHADPGRSVIAWRGLAGIAQGAGEYSLPPDQRFYGGGSSTFRGFRYQAVGPEFKDGTPIGGTAISAASIEFRQRFGANFGAAVFADAGQVSASLRLTPENVYIGIGAGIRYYTPIGPIRLDLAFPTKRYSTDDDAFEVYIGLGQAF
jgi:translocation and assembly module TamA